MSISKKYKVESRKNKGFTLIELLVVIAIIGVLATVSINTYAGYQKKARDGQRKFDLRNIQAALEQYYSQMSPQQYPNNTSYSGLITELGPGQKNLLKVAPHDPIASQDYVYTVLSSGQNYGICAKLENLGDPDLTPTPKYPIPSGMTNASGYNYCLTAP